MKKLYVHVIVTMGLVVIGLVGFSQILPQSTIHTVNAASNQPQPGYTTFVSAESHHIENMQYNIDNNRHRYANWIVEVSAVNEQPEVIWTVNVWEYFIIGTEESSDLAIADDGTVMDAVSQGVWKELIAQTQYALEIVPLGEPLHPGACQWMTGEGHVVDNLIHFGIPGGQGDGLQCELLQSFHDEAHDLGHPIDPICNCKGPYGTAIAEPYDQYGSNPLFSYPNGLAYGIDNGTSYLGGWPHSHAISYIQSPSWFPDFNKVVRSELAPYDNVLSAVHELGDDCKQRHLENGVLMTALVGMSLCDIKMNTQETTIYIGYDPDEEIFFNGTLAWAEWDPSCYIPD